MCVHQKLSALNRILIKIPRRLLVDECAMLRRPAPEILNTTLQKLRHWFNDQRTYRSLGQRQQDCRNRYYQSILFDICTCAYCFLILSPRRSRVEIHNISRVCTQLQPRSLVVWPYHTVWNHRQGHHVAYNRMWEEHYRGRITSNNTIRVWTFVRHRSCSFGSVECRGRSRNWWVSQKTYNIESMGYYSTAFRFISSSILAVNPSRWTFRDMWALEKTSRSRHCNRWSSAKMANKLSSMRGNLVERSLNEAAWF